MKHDSHDLRENVYYKMFLYQKFHSEVKGKNRVWFLIQLFRKYLHQETTECPE